MAESNNEREMGWNEQIEDDGKEFEPLPPGEYDFVIERFERGRSKGTGKLPACNMAIVYFTVIAPDGREVRIRENFILHTSLEWKLSELFCSVGLKRKGEPITMNWQALPGKRGRARIKQEPGMNDPSMIFNRIDKLLPYEPPKFTPGQF